MHRNRDIIGEKFGELLVIDEDSKDSLGHRMIICRCSCGATMKYTMDVLLSGKKTHCKMCKWGKDSKTIRQERSLYRIYNNGAKRRNIEFTLLESEFYEIIRKPCHYCGKYRITRNSHTKEKINNLNGVDRVNSRAGYTLENSLPCCTFCNQAKNDRTYHEFLEWAKELYEFQSKTLTNT